MEYKDALFRFEIADQLLGFLDTDLTGKVLLDIGCGSGNMLLAAIHKNAKECIGVDIDLKDLGDNHFSEIARQYNIDITNIRTYEVRIENINFSDNSFDIITLIDSIEHMDNPEIILKEISRLLKPGGFFLLNVSPLYYSPLGHHLFIYFPKEEYPWVHLYKNFNDLIKEKNVEAWYLDHLQGLNKITSAKILNYSKKCGLRLLKCQTVEVGREIFSQFNEKIDPGLMPPSIDDLFIESNTILFTK